MMNLDQLQLNNTGKIDKINCNETLKRRLLDLGLIKGTKIIPIYRSPFGDPTAYEIRGTIIALRKKDSMLIMLKE